MRVSDLFEMNWECIHCGYVVRQLKLSVKTRNHVSATFLNRSFAIPKNKLCNGSIINFFLDHSLKVEVILNTYSHTLIPASASLFLKKLKNLLNTSTMMLSVGSPQVH